jgi:hypothetical protein
MEEIKRRTLVVRIFPNPAAYLHAAESQLRLQNFVAPTSPCDYFTPNPAE